MTNIDINCPIWQKERVELWRNEIKKRLQRKLHDDPYSMGQLRILEQYYMAGKEPDFDRDDRYCYDPITFVLRLWLHPDQSHANWCKIRDAIFHEDRTTQVTNDVEENIFLSIRFLRYAGDNSFLDKSLPNTYNTQNGVFYGAESRLAPFFLAALDNRTVSKHKVEAKKICFSNILTSPPGVHGTMLDWLESEKLINQHIIYRFLVDQWHASLKDVEEAYYVKEHPVRTGKKETLMFFHTVLHYPFPDASDCIRKQYAFDVKDTLDNKVLPDFIAHWWNIVKTSNSLEEVIERAEPTFTIPKPPPPPPPEKTLKEKLLEKRMQGKKKRRGRLV